MSTDGKTADGRAHWQLTRLHFILTCQRHIKQQQRMLSTALPLCGSQVAALQALCCTLYTSRALSDASDPIWFSAVSWNPPPPPKRNVCSEQIGSDMCVIVSSSNKRMQLEFNALVKERWLEQYSLKEKPEFAYVLLCLVITRIKRGFWRIFMGKMELFRCPSRRVLFKTLSTRFP